MPLSLQMQTAQPFFTLDLSTVNLWTPTLSCRSAAPFKWSLIYHIWLSDCRWTRLCLCWHRSVIMAAVLLMSVVTTNTRHIFWVEVQKTATTVWCYPVLQQRVLKDQRHDPQQACLEEKYARWGGSIMGKCLYSLISHVVTGRTLGCHGESCWNGTIINRATELGSMTHYISRS